MIKAIREIYRKHKIIFQKQGLKPMLTAILNSAKLRMCNFIRSLIIKNTKVDEKLLIFHDRGRLEDNSFALYKYMIDNGFASKYRFIWFVNEPAELKKYRRSHVKFIKFPPQTNKETLVFEYYKNKVKYFFFTQEVIINNLKQAQSIVYLGHGCGFKQDKNQPDLGKHFDIALVPGPFFARVQPDVWHCNSDKLLVLGFPRNDTLIHLKNKKTASKIKNILWMPTFRKSIYTSVSEEYLNNETGLPLLTSKQLIEKLDSFLDNTNAKITLKIHPASAELPVFGQKYRNIEIVTNEMLFEKNMQLYEFVAESDALITDYSSMSIDYLLLDRPIGFILSDYAEYKASRGFSVDDPREYMPGAHIYTFEDLLMFIDSVKNDEDNFTEQRESIKKIMHINTDGTACEKILDYLNITTK